MKTILEFDDHEVSDAMDAMKAEKYRHSLWRYYNDFIRPLYRGKVPAPENVGDLIDKMHATFFEILNDQKIDIFD